jgi:hypothetical protein
MKIINRKTFLEMTGDVLFQEFSFPNNFRTLEFKRGFLSETDFITLDLSFLIDAKDFDDRFSILEHAVQTGSSIELDFENNYRNGYVQEDQLFAVWEARDIEKLIAQLQEIYKGGQ